MSNRKIALVAKVALVATDLGLLAYWTLTALGIVSVGGESWIKAWNWSFFPLDLAAIAAGLIWSTLRQDHPWRGPVYAAALALTHAAGLLAISFFALYGSWDASWWLVNLWLTLMPLGLALLALVPTIQCRSDHDTNCVRLRL